MFNKLQFPALLYVLLCCTSCGILLTDQTPPEVRSAIPASGQTDVDPYTAIRLSFSEAMDRETVERAFSLSSAAGGETTGVFTWAGNTLIFTPREPLDVSQEYMIRLTKQAEDARGNNLLDDFTASFTLAGKGTTPILLAHWPEDASFLATRTNDIILHFSTNMDIVSLHGAFSVNPSLTGILSLESNDTTLRFHPTTPLVHATVYTVRVSAETRDARGNRLDRERSFSFTVGTDFDKPGLLSFSTQGGPDLRSGDQLITNMHRRIPVVFTFTEPMAEQPTANAFSIKPPVEGEIRVMSNVLVFTPADGFLPETVHTLQIADTATDLQGNQLTRTEKIIIKTDAADSRYLRVTSVRNETNFPWTQNIMVPVTASTLTNLRIVFSSPVGYLGILPHFSIEYFSGTHPSSGGMIGNVQMVSNDTVMLFDLMEIGEGNIYKLNIGRDAFDLLENPMQDDWVFFFQT